MAGTLPGLCKARFNGCKSAAPEIKSAEDVTHFSCFFLSPSLSSEGSRVNGGERERERDVASLGEEAFHSPQNSFQVRITCPQFVWGSFNQLQPTFPCRFPPSRNSFSAFHYTIGGQETGQDPELDRG